MSEIWNLNPDPSCLRQAWWKTANTTAKRCSDNRWKYTNTDTSKNWGFAAVPRMGEDRYGRVLCAIVETDSKPSNFPAFTINSVDNVWKGAISDTRYWIAGTMNREAALAHELQISSAIPAMKLLASAVYTPEGWAHVQALLAKTEPPKLFYPWWGTPTSATQSTPQPPVLIP